MTSASPCLSFQSFEVTHRSCRAIPLARIAQRVTDLRLVAVYRSTIEMPVADRRRPQHGLGNLLAGEAVGAERAQPEHRYLCSGVQRSPGNSLRIHRVGSSRQCIRLRRCDHVMTLIEQHRAETPTCGGPGPRAARRRCFGVVFASNRRPTLADSRSSRFANAKLFF